MINAFFRFCVSITLSSGVFVLVLLFALVISLLPLFLQCQGAESEKTLSKESCIIILWGKDIRTNMGRNPSNKRKGIFKSILEFNAITIIDFIADIAAGLSAKKNEKKRKLFFGNTQFRITIR